MHKAGWITDTVTSYIRFCKDMFAHQTTRTKNPGLQQNSSSFDIPRRKPTELGMESCSHFQSTKNELLGKVGKKIFQPSTLRECGKAFRTPPATGDPQCLHLRHLICSTFRILPLLAFLLHPRHSVKTHACHLFQRQRTRKAPGPDGESLSCLKFCCISAGSCFHQGHQ